MTAPEHIASMEDEDTHWYARTEPADALAAVRERIAVVRACAALYGHAWTWILTPEHMRPYAQADCEAASHDLDADGDPIDEACDCRWKIDEGWMMVCPADHPDAVAVWRADYREPPGWHYTLRRRLRALHPSERHRRRPVLWGGRVERRTTRLDRLLLGRGQYLVLGDRQLRIGETALRWCPMCWAHTPHRSRLAEVQQGTAASSFGAPQPDSAWRCLSLKHPLEW